MLYLEDKVKYYKSRNWTNFITLEPVKLIQNIFGGGDVQRNQLTITDIETKINQLKDNQDRLENQLIIEQDNIKSEVAIVNQANFFIIKHKQLEINNY